MIWEQASRNISYKGTFGEDYVSKLVKGGIDYEKDKVSNDRFGSVISYG